MKILYFGDPLIGPDRKDFIDGIVDCSTRFFNAMRSSDFTKYEFRSVTNEFPADRMIHYSENYIVPSNYFLNKLGISNRYELLGKWFSGQYNDALLNTFADFYSNLLKDFKPDIIFTLSPVPYLQKIFPDALVLHHEASLFTRYPFELSLFLDPFGLFQNALYEKYADDINRIKLTVREQKLVDQLKYYYKLLMLVNNPYKNIMIELYKSFEKIILIPFQVSQYYYYDPRIVEKDPLLLLKNMMKEIDPEIGVIVTFHPTENVLHGEELEMLKQEFPNLIYSYEIQNEKAPSNYLIPFVDGVGCVSSKVGLQTCLLDNKLLALGACFHGIADELDISNLPSMFTKEKNNTDSLIYWMAAKYAVNAEYIFSEDWLPPFLEKSLEKFRAGKIDKDFYENIDDPEVQINAIIDQIKRYIPSTLWDYNGNRDEQSFNNLLTGLEEFENAGSSLVEKRKDLHSHADEEINAILKEAEEKIESGEYDEAEEILKGLLSENDKNIEALNDLAVVKILKENYSDAADFLSQVLALDSNNQIARENYEYLLSKNDNDEKAYLETLVEEVALVNSNEDANKNLVENQSVGNEMIDNINDELNDYPVAAKIEEAENLIRSENIVDAKEILHDIVENYPDNLDAMNNLSVIAIMENEYDEAKNIFNKIFETDPDNEIAINNMAILQQRMAGENSFLINRDNATVSEEPVNEEDLFEDIACPFCNEVDAVTYRSSADIVQCKACDVVYLRHRYKKEIMYKLYQSYADDGSHMALPANKEEIKSAVLRRNYWMDEILEFTKPEGTLLDIGCGWGAFLDNARDRGFTPRGIEMTKKCVTFANETLNILITNEQFEDTPIEPKSINVVSMNHVFEHLPYPLEALKKIYNVLDDGGLFCGIVPNISSYVSQNLEDEWYWLDPNYHYVHYSTSTLRKHLEANGFIIERLYTKTGDYGPENVTKVIKQKLGEMDNERADQLLTRLELNEMGEEIRFIARKI